jgi:hypothetical protein
LIDGTLGEPRSMINDESLAAATGRDNRDTRAHRTSADNGKFLYWLR